MGNCAGKGANKDKDKEEYKPTDENMDKKKVLPYFIIQFLIFYDMSCYL